MPGINIPDQSGTKRFHEMSIPEKVGYHSRQPGGLMGAAGKALQTTKNVFTKQIPSMMGFGQYKAIPDQTPAAQQFLAGLPPHYLKFYQSLPPSEQFMVQESVKAEAGPSGEGRGIIEILDYMMSNQRQ